jgi:hypothetical protein
MNEREKHRKQDTMMMRKRKIVMASVAMQTYHRRPSSATPCRRAAVPPCRRRAFPPLSPLPPTGWPVVLVLAQQDGREEHVVVIVVALHGWWR